MNTSRRLQFFVGRLFSTNVLHQPVAVKYVSYPPKSTHRRKNLQVTSSFLIHKNLSSNVNKVELEQSNEVEDDEIPTFKEFLSQLPSQDKYMKLLMNALDCNKEDFQLIQQQNLYWRSLPIEVVLGHIKAFEELGVLKHDLVINSSLLFLEFENYFETLSAACQELELDGHILLPLLRLPKKLLEAFLKASVSESKVLGSHKNRIKYFSDKLEIPGRSFTDLLLVHNYLLKLPLERIIGLMDALLEANVNKIYITRDLWVFKSNFPQALERLKICQEVGLKDIKPWIVRCPESVFVKTLQKHTKILALSNGMYGLSWEQFVAKLLDCPVQEVEAMARYDKRVTKCSFIKAKNTIEFLQSEGFTSKEILRSPHVFFASISTQKKRLNMIKEAGLDPHQHTDVLRRMVFNAKAYKRIFKSYMIGEDYDSAQKHS